VFTIAQLGPLTCDYLPANLRRDAAPIHWMPGRSGPANGRESTADENVPAPAFGGDICSALEITAVGRALARLDDDDKASLRRSDTGGLTPGIWEQIDPRVQSVDLVTENRATDLILQSRKHGAGPPS
jgi:hypothetical protein